MEPVVGFEPTTDGLQNRCSTTELNWRQKVVRFLADGRTLATSRRGFNLGIRERVQK